MSVAKTFECQKFKALTLHDTTITVWQERDRLHICLARKADDKTLVEWQDDDAYQAVDDGFLSIKEAKLGRLERHVRQGGALHQSAFDYWDTHLKPKPQKKT